MSSRLQNTPRTNIPNTIVKYSNGIDNPVTINTGISIISCFNSNPELFIVAGDINEPVPYDCVIRNAVVFVIVNGSTTTVKMKLNKNGVVAGDGDGVEIDIPPTTGGLGKRVSGTSFSDLKKGDLICWQFTTSTGATISRVSYVSMDLIPT